MNERMFYVPFNTLLCYIGTPINIRRDKKKDDTPSDIHQRYANQHLTVVWDLVASDAKHYTTGHSI